MFALRWRRLQWHRYARARAHVWPSAIVVVNPQLKGAPEMPLTQRDEKVQTLSTHSAYEPFTRRIRQRRPHGCSQDPDRVFFRSRHDTAIEILALRQQGC